MEDGEEKDEIEKPEEEKTSKKNNIFSLQEYVDGKKKAEKEVETQKLVQRILDRIKHLKK